MSESEAAESEKPVGVFVGKGVALGLSRLSIAIDEQGNITAPPAILHLRFDVCPTWLEIARQHLAEAKRKREDRNEAWKGDNEDEKHATLEREFQSAMQAAVAAVIALDSFYAILKSKVELPNGLERQWKENGTSRAVQLFEVLKRGFRLDPKIEGALLPDLKAVYVMRNEAVHPTAEVRQSVRHPELNIGQEWRFVTYRTSNVENVVNFSAGLLGYLAFECDAKNEAVESHMETLRSRLEQVFPKGVPRIRVKSEQ